MNGFSDASIVWCWWRWWKKHIGWANEIEMERERKSEGEKEGRGVEVYLWSVCVWYVASTFSIHNRSLIKLCFKSSWTTCGQAAECFLCEPQCAHRHTGTHLRIVHSVSIDIKYKSSRSSNKIVTIQRE